MRHSTEFYKVVNAVINTLNSGDSVAYVTGGQGGSGYGVLDCNEDNVKVRMDLMQYAECEELDEDELLGDWTDELRKSGFDFWQLSNYGDNAACIQIAINPDNYVTSSYKLRDMICEEQDLKPAEITMGMNGYPRGLRGCVLLGCTGKTIEQMQDISDMYGVELVSLHRRDGWQLWECEGKACSLYDFASFMDERNDDLHWWSSYKEYVKELREYAREVRNSDIVAEMDIRSTFDAKADQVENLKLGDNEFLYCTAGYPYLTDPIKAERMVDHFSYDTHNYMLALDCMME